MVIYSHSKLSTFEQCQLKYKFKYIDRLKPEIKQSIEGFLGGIVHDSLEFIYIEASKGRIVELDEVIEYYIKKWNCDFSSEIKIVKEEYNTEYYFNKGVKFLIDYFTENYPFNDNTIAVEKLIMIDLDNSGKYKIQGYIDRLVHNKESNIFEVHDYKTGGFLKTQEELDNDRQLALYSIGIRKMFENVSDVHLIWHFLDFNKKMSSRRSIEDLEKLKQNIICLINKIESTREFNASPGILCKWCEFSTYCQFKP
ncbi:PD-(D/E)XK nuclease superfamily protein [uncultured archaeon]|nr:PD-(D/E)XK nuclease superfamily protein [uncultured archaeon]